ncbi:PREDICTED: apyrase [Ceratosolen solmsi marchali]|uniref:Apyrase n=1 Tax=Ceratosolen solmsi marchali TaxID=326594 RepID=A0AAJ6YEL5_9HYME|nr:PREDICTED: apyrase [Ceratosolen solmsi marchali]
MTILKNDQHFEHKAESSDTETMLSRDWRQALRTPHIYRVGNSSLRVQSQFLLFVLFLFLFIFFYYGYPLVNTIVCSAQIQNTLPPCQYYFYNRTYPLTLPVKQFNSVSYAIAIVSDLDERSKSVDEENVWVSYLKKGRLTWRPSRNFISVAWEEGFVTLSSSLAMKGRGMELSELVTFDGRLLTFDDRTGMIYFFEGDRVYPWVILMDGNGKHTKGFKSEWATVKDEQLYVGSMGKEWTTNNGEIQNNNPQWIKVISPHGEVHSRNWISNYKRLREAINIEFPGYVIHESGVWSNIHHKWFFIPRRCSKEAYNDTKDEVMSCNVMLTADETFVNIEVTYIGKLIPIRGFSSFKFLPGSKDTIIVALKTEEYHGDTATYITAFNINGQIIMPDIKVSNKKFEGLEFV